VPISAGKSNYLTLEGAFATGTGLQGGNM